MHRFSSHRPSSDRGLRLLAGVILAAAPLVVVGAGLIVAPGSASAAVCTDSWTNTSGGAWDTGTNWSKGSAPTSTDVACITAAGSYTVTVGNETITVAGLTVGGSGSTPELAIGNGGAGFAAFTVTGAIANAGTVSLGFGGTYTAGSVTNTGTVLVPATGFGSHLVVAAFDNQGSFTVDDATSYSLPTSAATLTNDTTGTVTVATGGSLTVSSPAGQTGTVDQAGLIENHGALAIADHVSVSGGSVCDKTPAVGVDGGTTGGLAFAATVASGPACGSGEAVDHLLVSNITGTLSGTIPSAYSVTLGDGGPSFAHITDSSASTNAGSLSVAFGATLSDTSTLTNTGTLLVPATGFTGALNLTNLDNKGTFTVATPTAITLPAKKGKLTNDKTGTLTVAATGSVTVSSPTGKAATVTERGMLENEGSVTIQDKLSVAGGTVCDNAVHIGIDGQSAGETLAFAKKVGKSVACPAGQAQDQLLVANTTAASIISGSVPAGWAVTIGDGGSGFAHAKLLKVAKVSGTLEGACGATITDATPLTNLGTLGIAPCGGFNTVFNLDSLSNSGTLVATGLGSINVAAGQAITNTSKGTVAWSANSTLGTLVNQGTVTVQPGDTLSVSGTYTQAPSGTYAPVLLSTTSFGKIAVTGTATLAGTVAPSLAAGNTVTNGNTFAVLTASGLGGTTFTTVTGTFSATYTATTTTLTFT